MSPGQGNLPSDSIKVVPGRSKLRVESSNPVPRGNPSHKTSKVKLISPEEAIQLSSGANQMAVSPPPRPKPARATSEVPKPVLAHRKPEAPRPVLADRAAGFRKEIVCGLRALSMSTTTVRQRTNRSRLLKSKTVDPPSPRALQIRSRVKQQATNATQVVEETIVEDGDRAKDHDSREILQSISDEELSELLLYRPALHPTWKERIVNSATLPKFDCEFWATPASNISRKAHRFSKEMPPLLKVELLPTCHVLHDAFDGIPRLSNIAVYFFPDEKKTERLKRKHDHLFEAMATRNAMIKVGINDTELLIFSSKLLDKTSQFIINTQKKTENFLWGCFLQTSNSQTLIPKISCQTDKDLDDGDIIDMELDTDTVTTPGLILELIAGSQSNPSSAPGKMNKEGSLPPGFEEIWAPPLVKLNIQGTSNPLSDLSGYAGIVRYQSGKWVFGYSRCHKSISEVAAGLLAIYQGLKILWDSGFRRIRLETTSLEIIETLTTKSDLFLKRKSILGVCKDMILKEWECDIYHISEEQNSCAEWLASSRRLEEQPQGLVFYEYPLRGLIDLLEKDRLAAI